MTDLGTRRQMVRSTEALKRGLLPAAKRAPPVTVIALHLASEIGALLRLSLVLSKVNF